METAEDYHDAAIGLIEWVAEQPEEPFGTAEYVNQITPAAAYTIYTIQMLGVQAATSTVFSLVKGAFLKGYECGRLAAFRKTLDELEDE